MTMLASGRVCYIAGPVRGYPNDNRLAFHEAARKLRAQGWTVHNPAEYDELAGVPLGEQSGSNLKQQMLWDLSRIAESDYVVLLDGWSQSSGVAVELAFARFANIPAVTMADVFSEEGL